MSAKTAQYHSVRERLTIALDSLREPDRALLLEALQLAEQTHEGQYRKSDETDPDGQREPYIVHPMRVALILIEELAVSTTAEIAAALLHDVVEDGEGIVTVEMINELFGSRISHVVSKLTKPALSDGVLRKDQLASYHDAIKRSDEAIRLIKLSDRLDNMRDIFKISDQEFHEKYLEETRAIFLPLARQTSEYLYKQLRSLCDELERRCAQPISGSRTFR